MFEDATRLRNVILPTLSKPTGGGLTQIDLPKVGILAGLDLIITGAISGTLSAPNAFGKSSIVRRARLAANGGLDLFNISGPGYHWALRDFCEDFVDISPQTEGRDVVAVDTGYDVSMFLPVQVNQRDTPGLFMLQNEQTLVSLLLDWEADATVATGATVTGSCVPVMHYFEVPPKPEDYPDFRLVHQILEDDTVIAGAGEQTYQVPRGNTLLGVYHIFIPGWTTARLRIQQGNNIYDHTPNSHGALYARTHGRTANLTGGAITGNDKRILWDMMGTDGLGAYGSRRDLLDTRQLTDIATVFNAVASGTLKTVRRQIIVAAG